jgi:hypothetical protein
MPATYILAHYVRTHRARLPATTHLVRLLRRACGRRRRHGTQRLGCLLSRDVAQLHLHAHHTRNGRELEVAILGEDEVLLLLCRRARLWFFCQGRGYVGVWVCVSHGGRVGRSDSRAGGPPQRRQWGAPGKRTETRHECAWSLARRLRRLRLLGVPAGVPPVLFRGSKEQSR